MIIMSGDPIYDEAKQSPLSAVRDEIEVLFNNQIGDQEAIVSNIIQDSNGNDVDGYIRKLIQEKELSINHERFTHLEVTDSSLFAEICDYVGVYNLPIPNSSFVYFLESKDFAITIIALDLLDGTTKVYMEPMELSSEFLIKIWEDAINKKNQKPNTAQIKGVTKGFPANWNIPHAGSQQIDKSVKRR